MWEVESQSSEKMFILIVPLLKSTLSTEITAETLPHLDTGEPLVIFANL